MRISKATLLAFSVAVSAAPGSGSDQQRRAGRSAGVAGEPLSPEGIPSYSGNVKPFGWYLEGAGAGTQTCDPELLCSDGRCWAQICYYTDTHPIGADVEPVCNYRYFGEC